MPIHLLERPWLAVPVVLAVLLAAAWGGATLAAGDTTPTALTVCVKNNGSIDGTAGSGGCSAKATAYPLVTQGQFDALTVRVSTLEGQVSQLQTLLAGVSRTTFAGKDTLQLSGMNLQIVSGSGSTDAAPNGLGNLIVGYDEGVTDASGSHDIVVGKDNDFPGFGGLVAGTQNRIEGDYATVLGGILNVASGAEASVVGGEENQATGLAASVGSGVQNHADGEWASILGGNGVTATGDYATAP